MSRAFPIELIGVYRIPTLMQNIRLETFRDLLSNLVIRIGVWVFIEVVWSLRILSILLVNGIGVSRCLRDRIFLICA